MLCRVLSFQKVVDIFDHPTEHVDFLQFCLLVSKALADFDQKGAPESHQLLRILVSSPLCFVRVLQHCIVGTDNFVRTEQAELKCGLSVLG